MKIVAIVPAYNEENVIGGVLSQLKNYVDQIIVVNDGSKDKTSQIAKDNGALVYDHPINRGLGGALGTGIKAALKNNADIMITFDADGQHDPEEIHKVIKPIIDNETDIVIGSRFLVRQPMPLFRRIGIPFFNFVALLLFGIKSTDSLSGMRAFSKTAAKTIEIRKNGMEASLEILEESQKLKLRIKEVPIKAIYTEYSTSKGLRFLPGLKFLIKVFTSKIIK
ncbi:MAG: glycosyltransferase family 2 protein [Candidatus Nealsonbacteria bacterium]